VISLSFLHLLIARLGRRLAAARLAAWVLLPLLAIGVARAENVYIMQLGLQGIYSVDIAAGGPATLLTAINSPSGTEGYTLAVRPSDGMLFYLDSNAANPNLWRWNPETPTVPPVLVGTPGAATTDVVRLGFDGANNLLAMSTTSSIWTLDQTTGGILSTTPLSGDLPTSSGDLCLNTSSGVLYMVAAQDVYTVTSAGVSTRLGTMTGIPGTNPNNLVTGCAFTRNGTLLISLYGGTGALYRVNLATLAVTALPNVTGVAGGIGDLATAPTRSADLRLAKTVNTSTPGSTVSFTVTVTNDGPNRAADVRVLDLLPSGLTLTGTTASQGTYYPTSPAAGVPAGTWRAGALQPGQSATLTMNATVTGTDAHRQYRAGQLLRRVRSGFIARQQRGRRRRPGHGHDHAEPRPARHEGGHRQLRGGDQRAVQPHRRQRRTGTHQRQLHGHGRPAGRPVLCLSGRYRLDVRKCGRHRHLHQQHRDRGQRHESQRDHPHRAPGRRGRPAGDQHRQRGGRRRARQQRRQQQQARRPPRSAARPAPTCA
jgi:uncharacterized repeat protein (TIGR01451 family)